MRSLVVYESMYGNTHTVAERIAEGLRAAGAVHVVPVGDVTEQSVATADLVVVGGPTHLHGMSSKASRTQAVAEQTLQAEAAKGREHEVDPDAEGPGLRDWFDGLALGRPILAAAFDTRVEGSPLFTGRASKGITKRLERKGFEVVCPPESFLVDKETRLLDGEEDRAATWGSGLLDAVARLAPHVDLSDRSGQALHDLEQSIESGGRFVPPR